MSVIQSTPLPPTQLDVAETMQLAEAIRLLPKKCRICIEGDIATGKSVLCNELATILRNHGKYVIVIDESIDMTLLDAYNANPVKYGLALQQSMYERRLRAITDAHIMMTNYTDTPSHLSTSIDNSSSGSSEGVVVLLDTGPLRELAFSEANCLSGNMSVTDYTQHIKVFAEKLAQQPELKPEFIALIDLPSTHSFEYIKRRARPGENKLTLEYLECVRHCHLTNIGYLRDPNLNLARKDGDAHPLAGCKRFIFARNSFVDARDVIRHLATAEPDIKEDTGSSIDYRRFYSDV